jgi:hypothetical protein
MEPKDKKLWNKIKMEAKLKFKVYPSAYANFYIIKKYKKMNGKFIGKKDLDKGLARWIVEKWVNICEKDSKNEYKKCGRPSTLKGMYPYCRPSVRINKKTPKTVGELTKKEIQKRCKSKTGPKKLLIKKIEFLY